MKLKSLTARLAALLCACGFAFSAWAADPVTIQDASGDNISVYEVSSGFYQDGETYTASRDFYITSKAGLEYLRDIVNGDKTNLDAYLASCWSGTVAGFYQTNVFGGKTVHLLADIDLNNESWVTIGYVHNAETSSTYYHDKMLFYGHFNGHGHKISNLKIVTFSDNKKGEYGLFGRLGAPSGQTFSNLTIENVKSTSGSYVGAFAGSGQSNPTTLRNCHVIGDVSLVATRTGGFLGIGNVNVSGCSVEATSGTGISGYYWVGGLVGAERAGTLSITDSTVSGLEITCTYNGCYSGAIVGKMGDGASGTCTISDNTIANCTIKGENVTQETLIQPNAEATSEVILSNNTIINASFVAQIGANKYETLAAAINAGKAGDTVEVLVDEIDCAGWTSVTIDSNSKLVTLNGNGVVLKNLSAPLFNKTGSGCKGVVVKNVTVKGANISTSSYAAAFLPYADSTETAYFENCHVVDSTITSTETYAAGFVAYAAGYNNQNDGPVFTTVTIKDCSVKNSTITGANSTGGLMGHATGSAWTLVNVEGTEVAGNTIACTGSSNVKAGSLFGTVGVAGQESYGQTGGIVVGGDSVVTNNTARSNGVATDRIFGRIGSTGGELAVTGGMYDGTANYANDTYDSTNGKIVISGGSFKTAPSADALAHGYAVTGTPNDDGYYTLEDLPVIATVTAGGTTKNYYDLHEALEAGKTSGTTITLLTDVDLSGVNWVPVGTSASPFTGVFDGNGKTISNLSVNDEALTYAGLLGYVTGSTFKNITISNVTVNAAASIGSLMGYCNTSSVTNCHVQGRIQLSGHYKMGGILGEGYTSFTDCSVICDGESTSSILATPLMKTDDPTKYEYEADNIGGMVGHWSEGAATIKNCIVKDISVTGYRKIGGMVAISFCSQKIEDVTVENVKVTCTAPKAYAEDNTSTTGMGGIVGQYHRQGGAYTGGWMKGATIKNVNLEATDSEALGIIKAGLVSSGLRDSAAAESPISKASMTFSDIVFEGENSIPDGVKTMNDAAFGPVYVAQIGETKYETLEAALTAVQDGETIELLSNVEVTAGLDFNKVGTYVIDGKGYALIAPQGGILSNYALFMGVAVSPDVRNDGKVYTVKNLTFRGFSGNSLGHVLRIQGVVARLESCTFENNTLSGSVVSSNFANLTMAGCTLQNNTATNPEPSAIVNVGSWADSDTTSVTVIDSCLFSGNTVSGLIGEVYINDAQGKATIKDCTFQNNTDNLAVVFLANSADVTGNLFIGNKVTVNNGKSTTILAGPWGAASKSYAINVNSNAFVDNTRASETGEVYFETFGTVGAYAIDCNADGNYWQNGGAPNYANNEVPENVDATFSASTFATAYAVNDNGCGVTVTIYVPPVAQIDETKYETLGEAISEAQNGDTVVLLADVDLGTTGLVIAEGKNFTLDIGEYDITGTVNGKLITNNGTIVVNGTTGCLYNQDISAQGHDAFLNNGTATINGGWFGDADNDKTNANAINRGAGFRNFGTATINGGHFTACDNYTNGGYAYAIINGDGENTPALVINNADVYGKNNGNIANNSGSVTVKDGTFDVSGSQSYYSVYSYSGNTVVEGGTFTKSGNSNSQFCVEVDKDNANNPGSIAVSGGYFTKPVTAEYCAEGVLPCTTPDEYTSLYTVRAANYVAQIGETKYESLAAAIAAVANGQTVKMLADAYETVTVNSGNTITIDLNGKTVTGGLKVYSGFVTLADTASKKGKLAGSVNVYATTEGEGYNSFTLAEGAVIDAHYGIILREAAGNTGYGTTINVAGTVKGNVWVMGNILQGNSVINVTGTVDATDQSDVGIAINGNVTVNVLPGANITSKSSTNCGTGIEVRAGTLNVTGGTIAGNGAPADVTANGSGTTSTGAGIAVSTYDNSPITLNVTGGTITGYAPLYFANTVKKTTKDMSLVVSGGVFKTTDGGTVVIANNEATPEHRAEKFVSGGYFSDRNIEDYLVEGKLCTTKLASNGLYAVVDADTVTFANGDTSLEVSLPDSFTYPSGDLAEIALANPTYTSDDYTFGGWQMTVGETTKVVSALPAGTIGNVMLVATWKPVTKIQIDIAVPTQESPQATEKVEIKVTDEWVEANVTVGQEQTMTDAIVDALNTKQDNDLTGLENYLLGLDGKDPNAKVKVESEQGASETAMPVKNTLAEKVQTADTGFTVKYSLDKVDTAGKVVENGEGAKQDTSDLELNLKAATSGDSKVAYYKMTATITKTVTIEDQPTEVAVSTVHSENTIGVLAVTEAPATAIIGVPWSSSTDSTSISVNDLVRTANLTPGDELKVYDPKTKTYKMWTLDDDKEWEPVNTSSGSGTSDPGEAQDNTVARGAGVWLTRKNPDEPIYLVGQATAAAEVATPLEKPAEGKQTWNLVAPPSVNPVNIADLLNSTEATDKVLVPTASVPKNIVKMGGKWGYIAYETNESGITYPVFVEQATLPAGTGFWYLNGDSDTDNKTLNW